MLTEGQVIVSEFNKLEGNRYFDTENQTSFEVDHITQVRCGGVLITADWLTDCGRKLRPRNLVLSNLRMPI